MVVLIFQIYYSVLFTCGKNNVFGTMQLSTVVMTKKHGSTGGKTMSGKIYNIQWFDFARETKFLVGLKRVATYHTANWCKILISSDQGFTMFEGDKFNQDMREDLVNEFGYVACRSQWLLEFVFVHFTFFLLSTQSRKISTLLCQEKPIWHIFLPLNGSS
jgi:hypothetical protein